MYWVAEVGSMHKGDKSLAFEMIRQFSQAGANVIKFQFGWNEEAQAVAGVAYNPVRYIDPWVADLDKWCFLFGVELMASIWSVEGLETAKSVKMKHYKIASQVWKNNPTLAQLILAEKHMTFVSGNAREENARPIYAVSKYPTYPGEIRLPGGFGKPYFYYGYSDHAHGIEACLLAAAKGAEYIEKHVCLDKTDLSVRDTPFSATPAEFAEMVRIGNGMRRHLENGD